MGSLPDDSGGRGTGIAAGASSNRSAILGTLIGRCVMSHHHPQTQLVYLRLGRPPIIILPASTSAVHHLCLAYLHPDWNPQGQLPLPTAQLTCVTPPSPISKVCWCD